MNGDIQEDLGQTVARPSQSPAPFYERDGVTLYCGEAADVLPHLHERGVVISDYPYSAHTHGKSRAGARKIASGSGYRKGDPQSWEKSSVCREVDFGFQPLTAAERRMFAKHACRLSARWCLAFSDERSDYLWRASFQAAGEAAIEHEIIRRELDGEEPLPDRMLPGLEYVRTAAWRKLRGTPQFTGDRPAIASENITICHPRGAKRWNGGGKHALYDFDFETDERIWYDESIVQERAGTEGAEPRIHTTQKPEGLMIALVEDFSEPDELVYDFTAGSCTTAIGCLRAKGGRRRFVGIERDRAMCEKAARRLEAELTLSTYHAATRGQVSLFGGG